MAAIRKGGHKALNASILDSSNKENRPPPKGAKRKQNIGALFTNANSKRRKTAEDPLGALFDSVKRRAEEPAASEGFFARFTQQQPKHRSVFSGFDVAVKAYTEGVSDSVTALLQPTCDELEARAKGLDIHGNPISRPGVPSEDDIKALAAEQRAVEQPLIDEEMDVIVPKASGKSETHHVKLSQVLEAFEKFKLRKDAEIDDLKVQLRQLNAEMEELSDDLRNDRDGAVKRANEELRVEMARIKKYQEAARQRLHAEFEKAREEDKAASAETNRKIQEFMMALQ